MTKLAKDGQDPADLDRFIAEITLDARGDDAQLQAFRRAFNAGIAVPCDGFVIGEPVSVVAFDNDGNRRRGLTVRCRREDGSEHVVAAADVVFPERSDSARIVTAYRSWLGLEAFPPDAVAAPLRRRRHKVQATDLDLSAPAELVALSVGQSSARCRLLGTDRIITLRATRLWHVVPGEILVVKPRKQWSYAGHPYLSGEIESTRLDAPALGLVPLRLEDQGVWNPDQHYWGEEDEPIEAWARPIIAHGPRPAFEMEQIVPGKDPGDMDSDPIGESVDLKNAGDYTGAHKLLEKLCQADLRCLDAHAHLGNLVFAHRPQDALRHYEVGVRIGELSLPPDFTGLLLWADLDNRPFLRCLHNSGLCLWRLGHFDQAEQIFDRMLWLNPSDNQGARFLLSKVRAKAAWQDG